MLDKPESTTYFVKFQNKGFSSSFWYNDHLEFRTEAQAVARAEEMNIKRNINTRVVAGIQKSVTYSEKTIRTFPAQ